ncbi:MAG TPA: hypothetical protein VGI86_08065 [Acidimicrobiia bacterium]|jgi:hypothetical protein
MKQWHWMMVTICALATVAHAQPIDDLPGAGSGSADAGSAESPPTAPVVVHVEHGSPVDEPAGSAKPVESPPKPDPDIYMPELIATPTGWLLPAAVLYSRTGLDTSGGFTTDERVGLGDVAEFGLSTLDDVRAKNASTDSPYAIQPYVAATFRIGVAEDRLFDGQPGLVLGFRKSFSHTDDGVQSRIAELTLVASKHFTSAAAVHIGAAFWDASLSGASVDTALDDRTDHSLIDQIRAFGGIEVWPFPRSEVLADLAWAPVFCYTCDGPDQIKLSPELSWGVRYKATPWLYLESGVHVFDIDQAKLLDAQIYGQVTFVTWGLRHAVDSIR